MSNVTKYIQIEEREEDFFVRCIDNENRYEYTVTKWSLSDVLDTVKEFLENVYSLDGEYHG